MSNVVEFNKSDTKQQEGTEELVWECMCGHALFYLHENGSVECGGCGKYSEDICCFTPELD